MSKKNEVKRIKFWVEVPETDGEKSVKRIELEVVPPNLTHITKAQMVYNEAMDVAIRSKAPFRMEVEHILKKRGIWDDDKQAEYKKLNDEMTELEKDLKKGGKKLSEARALALKIRDKREELLNLTAPKRILDSATAESQAEIERFNYFVANCTQKADDGTPFFAPRVNSKGEVTATSLQVYMEQAREEYAQTCARNFGVLQYGLDADFDKKQPENVFLLKYKFVREKDLKLIDSQGRLIDRDGHLVDEEGWLINEEGERVDRSGKKINAEPEPPELPFTDEDGNPLT